MKLSDVSSWTARWGQVGVLAFVGALSFALLIPLWLEVNIKLDQMRASHRDNVIWTLTQLEVEFMELEKAALILDHDGEEALPQLYRRFNVFYSRVATLLQSPLYRKAIGDAGEQENLAKVQSEIEALLPLIDGPAETLLEQRKTLLERISAMHGPARRIVTNGNFVLTANTEAAREDAAHLVGRLGFASLILFGSLFGLAIMFSRLYVTYKSRARENLLTTQRLVTVIETSPDAIVVTDASGRVQEFNSAAANMLGYLPPEARGMDFSTMLKGETGEFIELPLAERSVFRQRMTGLMRSGTSVPLEVSQGATSMDAQPVYVYFLRDISDRLASEDALKASLEKAVAGERAKAHFLAVMSHEMRTPLNGILGVIELMQDRLTRKKDRHYLTLLERSGKVLLDHVNEVLELTEIEARGIKLNAAPFNLDELLDEVIASMRPAAEVRGNQLRLNTSPAELGFFNGDAMRLRQIVVNLLSNAVKFTEFGDIEVLVAAYDTTDERLVEIQVIDTGIGIEPSQQETVFDDFVRGRNEWEAQIEGSGLGLGIVRRIVTVMNGEIGVESEQGEGSLFWVRLPLEPVDPETLRQENRIEVSDDGAGEMEILIVEDNATNRFVLREMLEQDGHKVFEAENGQIGADLAMSHKFDVILMDINMPVMGGVEATREIRRHGLNTETRIIALTAHVLDQDAQLYREGGLDAVVAKPISRRNIRSILSGKGQVNTVEQPKVTLDLQVLEQMAKTMPSFKLKKVLDGVLAEGDAFIDSLDNLPNLPHDAVIQKVHELAGVTALVGAVRMRRTLSQLEGKLHSSSSIDLYVWQDTLRALWADTRTELLKYEARLLVGQAPS